MSSMPRGRVTGSYTTLEKFCRSNLASLFDLPAHFASCARALSVWNPGVLKMPRNQEWARWCVFTPFLSRR